MRTLHSQPLVHRVVGISLAALVCWLATGCAPALPPGKAGLKVQVLAEPKAGYQQPADLSGGYAGGAGDDADGRANPFRLIDYRNLEDIVVYAVPRSASSDDIPPPKPVSIDVSAGQGIPPVYVASVGSGLTIRNAGTSPITLYFRGESGALADLGVVAAGASTRTILTVPGPVTLLRETGGADDVAAAVIFVAPNGWVARTVSGGSATFAPMPPGEYVLHCWHWRLPGSELTVTLPPDRFTSATATVGVNALPKTK